MKPFLLSRVASFNILKDVVSKKMTAQMAFSKCPLFKDMPLSDVKFARLLVLSTLRYYGQAESILKQYVKKKFTGKTKDIELLLIMGIIQLRFLNTASHAAVDTTVELTKIIKQRYMSGFVNSVMHSVEKDKNQSLPDVLLNIPIDIREKWINRFGEEKVREILKTSYEEPTLDLFVKENPEFWAEKLNGTVLPNGTVRCRFTEEISLLKGFDEGAWWVQEASASLPALMFNDIFEKHGADLCAAPGGKTAQLVLRGAKVDAYDISENRLKRLKENLHRLKIEDKVNVVCSDARLIDTEKKYDFILLDAPCSATGTIKRHPDLFFIRNKDDIERLSILQKELLSHAYHLLNKGGELVYSTCSIDEDENEKVVIDFLNKHPDMKRVLPTQKFFEPFLNSNGAVEIIPNLLQKQDGFYAVLLQKM